jgi:hypothetical protein
LHLTASTSERSSFEAWKLPKFNEFAEKFFRSNKQYKEISPAKNFLGGYLFVVCYPVTQAWDGR